MTATAVVEGAPPRRAKSSLSRNRRWALIASYFFLILFAIFFLVPPYYMIVTSLKSDAEVAHMATNPWIIANGMTLDHQGRLIIAGWSSRHVWRLEKDGSLVSLAYDCRRPDKFRGEIFAALKIVDRGDMAPADMHGAWAGEIGQTQFLPSSYLKFAVDYDGNGRRDLIHSVPDVLASTANYLKGYGWQRGQPWGEGTPNFQVLLQWNASQIYTKTVAAFAQQLADGQ